MRCATFGIAILAYFASFTPVVAAPSSDGAAVRALALAYGQGPKRVRDLRLAPPFATIVHIGEVEGPDTGGPTQLLYRQYAFGWQLVDVAALGAFRTCDLRADGVPRSLIGRLSVTTLPARATEACRPPRPFEKPSRDEEAVRALTPTFFASIPSVKVVGDYAFESWVIPGGGEVLYHRRGRSWTKITGGGGALSACEMVGYGVPLAIGKQFAPLNFGSAGGSQRDCKSRRL